MRCALGRWRTAPPVVRYALVGAVWLGANVVALIGCDVYETWTLAEQYEVPVRVLRQYDAHSLSIPIEGSETPASLWYRLRPPPFWSGRHGVPLVVSLHGSGERGSDNVQQLGGFVSALCRDEFAEVFPCAILAPQCPTGSSWSSSIGGTTDVLDGVLMMIDDVLRNHRVDPDRVYLIGYSMGGFGAWELASREPERFAAVIPIASGGDPKLGRALVNVPIWAVHGVDDPVVPIDGSREMVEAIRHAGGNPQFSELTDVGHQAWTDVVRPDSAILEWLFRQQRAVSGRRTTDPDIARSE